MGLKANIFFVNLVNNFNLEGTVLGIPKNGVELKAIDETTHQRLINEIMELYKNKEHIENSKFYFTHTHTSLCPRNYVCNLEMSIFEQSLITWIKNMSNETHVSYIYWSNVGISKPSFESGSSFPEIFRH